MTGVDTIKLFSSDRINGRQIEEVRNIVRKLIGSSIVEASKKELVIQYFIDESRLDATTLIRRLSVIVSTMLDEALESLVNLDIEIADDVIKREDEANSIYWLLTRLLLSAETNSETINKGSVKHSLGFTTCSRLVSKYLESIADSSKSIAKIALDLHSFGVVNKKELEQLVYLETLTKEQFKKSIDSLFARNVNLANEAINQSGKLEVEIENQLHKSSVPYFRAIAMMLAMISEDSAGIAAMAINTQIYNSMNALIGS